MAKTVNPLLSMEASGSVGKSLTYGKHLGRNVVRLWTKPANPKTVEQGDQRLVFSYAGAGAARVKSDSQFGVGFKSIVPAGFTIQNGTAKVISDLFPTASALFASFDGATNKALFTAKANAIGVLDYEIPYAGTIKSVSNGEVLYALAYSLSIVAASNPTIFNYAPFTTPITSWDADDIDDFVDVITNPA